MLCKVHVVEISADLNVVIYCIICKRVHVQYGCMHMHACVCSCMQECDMHASIHACMCINFVKLKATLLLVQFSCFNCHWHKGVVLYEC